MAVLKLSEDDHELYKDFAVTVYERWQQEVVESVFDIVNEEADKIEKKRGLKAQLDEPALNCMTQCIPLQRTFF